MHCKLLQIIESHNIPCPFSVRPNNIQWIGFVGKILTGHQWIGSHQLWGFPWFSCKFILNQYQGMCDCVTVQAQAADEAAVENQDQMPADPQEPLEETVESCLLHVMQVVDIVGI